MLGRQPPHLLDVSLSLLRPGLRTEGTPTNGPCALSRRVSPLIASASQQSVETPRAICEMRCVWRTERDSRKSRHCCVRFVGFRFAMPVAATFRHWLTPESTHLSNICLKPESRSVEHGTHLLPAQNDGRRALWQADVYGTTMSRCTGRFDTFCIPATSSTPSLFAGGQLWLRPPRR